MRTSYVLTGLVWGLAFGLLEAAYFTRANHVYPVSMGNVMLAMLFAAGFVLLAWLAGAVASLLRARNGRGSSVAAQLAGPWFLLLVLAVSTYRDKINARPSNLGGLLGTLVTVALLVGLLAAGSRLFAGRPASARRSMLVVGLLLVIGGGIWLGSARPFAAPQPAVAAAAAAQEASGFQETGLRVMLIGLDGGTWKIYDPLLEQDRLPAHEALIARGVQADLKTTLPTYSPPLWTSIASSRTDQEHNIHDHIMTALPWGLPTVPHQVKHFRYLTKVVDLSVRTLNKMRPFPPVFTTSEDVLTRRIWDILDERGYPSLVVDWYVTYPALLEHGIMVSDQLHRHRDDAEAWPGLVVPDSLTPLYRHLVVTPEELPDDRLFALLDTTGLDGPGRAALRSRFSKWFTVIGKEMARDLTTEAIAADALGRLPDWRFAGVYYRAMDNIHHMNWQWKDLPGGDLDQHPERRFRGAIDRYYEYCDGLLADMLRFADEKTVVIVMSDHGFEDERYHHSRAPDGFFVMAGGPVLHDPVRHDIHIYDIVPTVLALLGLPVAQDMHGRVAREMIDPAFWAAHPIASIPTYETGPRAATAAPHREMDQRTIQHLRALGYID